MLTVIQSPGLNLKPNDKFSLLFLVAGADASKTLQIACNAWDQVKTLSPFDQDGYMPPTSKAFAVYCDTNPIALDFQLVGKQLRVPDAQKNAVFERIQQQTVPLDAQNQRVGLTWPAASVWEPEGRFGAGGSLIIVLAPGTAEGELYQLSASPEFPMPFVAVQMFGTQWHKVIARAIAQMMVYLDDEYELPGEEFRVAKTGEAKRSRTNVLLLTDTQRERLFLGQKLHDVLGLTGWFAAGWSVSKGEVLPFYPHPTLGASPDETVRKADGRMKLVEGGAGYRLRAVRCDFDCLLRRKPYSPQLPIQDKEAQFCRVCRHILSTAITLKSAFSLEFERQRVLLNSQRPLIDTVYWQSIDKHPAPPTAPVLELLSGQGGGKWRFKWAIDPSEGFKITDVSLRDLPGVIYAPIMDIFERIGFRDLAVKFAGEAPRTLAFADAWANTKSPPVFEVLRQAHFRHYLGGYRLGLTWAIPDRWDIEAVLSVVFKDVNNDFDPGGAVGALKCYPQISMRYRRPATPTKAKLPKVEYLQGTIEFVANNIIPANLASSLPGHLKHMANGSLSLALFTDSNASLWDSKWDWTRHQFVEGFNDILLNFIFNSPKTPEFGLWDAEWRSGRLLAGVRFGNIVSPSSLVGPTARRAHVFEHLPTLPYWSWLFDYMQAEVTGSRSIIGCYSTKDKTASGAPANGPRSLETDWPTQQDTVPYPGNPSPFQTHYQRTIQKLPRQGYFDNVHLHPNMGMDEDGRQIVSAPFCGELCMHLHWRWGLVSLSGAIDREKFLGWGDGRRDRGAHTMPGAPLIPPNQHLELQFEKQAGKAVVRYTVRADDPDFDAYQVFLEQGIGIAFDYGGLDPKSFAMLSVAMGEVGPSDVETDAANLGFMKLTNPRGYDELARLRFHAFYPKLRFFSELGVKENVQQSPEQGGGADTTLEKL